MAPSSPRRLRSRDQTHVASLSTPGCGRAGREAGFGAPPRHAGQANCSAEPRRRGQIRDPLRRRTAIASHTCSSAFRLRTHRGGLQQRPGSQGPGPPLGFVGLPRGRARLWRARGTRHVVAWRPCHERLPPQQGTARTRYASTNLSNAVTACGCVGRCIGGNGARPRWARWSVAPRKTGHFTYDIEIYIDTYLDCSGNSARSISMTHSSVGRSELRGGQDRSDIACVSRTPSGDAGSTVLP